MKRFLALLIFLLSVTTAAIGQDVRSEGIVLGYTPDFSDAPTHEVYVIYGEADELGRCTGAQAMLGPELSQGPDRSDISEFRPTGFHNAAYAFVQEKWVYHRCHLIGRQLGGADEMANLFTGTRTLNVDGMLPWENRIAAYIRKTGNHVLYRAAPQYAGNDMVCTSVLLEALSVEDEGRGLCFAVLCLNEEPGVAIDYATGYSTRADDWEHGGTEISAHDYRVNTKSGKFHLPDCEDAKKISGKNRRDVHCHRSLLLSQGNLPCGKCRP